MRVTNFILLAAAAVMTAVGSEARAIDPEAFAWPTQTRESRPWTRWWWLGSAVDDVNLTKQLELLHSAGVGGLEICPIYGAKGAESRYLPFLSDKWMAALGHTTREAERLGMGVDMTTGTGWPFGGPQVGKDDSSMSFSLKKGEDGRYEVVMRSPVQKVKRAAPGGEGNVVDPYSATAMEDYLKPFTAAFAKFDAPMPRAQFHDSFEYYGANWTRDFFEQFKKRRGYDLREHLAALAGEGDRDVAARVCHDYRETIADLHLAFLKVWVDWAHAHHELARNQAHGSPTNLLDAYAIADIPETEIFGPASQPDNNVVFLKFASSAAHVTGRPLASSESFTWLGEHFQVSLAECKPAADLLFSAGINHVFFHGMPYSPEDVAWPGWLFYASLNFGPEGGIFHDLPAFTSYITRVQSVLQQGTPSTDYLIYFPVHDLWQTPATGPRDALMPLQVHNQSKWLTGSDFERVAADLIGRGYSVDYVSDRLLQSQDIRSRCRWIVVPPCRLMEPETARRLAELSKAGTPVVFRGAMPSDVPGLSNVEQRRADLKGALAEVKNGGQSSIARESLTDVGLRYVRRTHARGFNYFLSNTGDKAVDGWIPLATPAAAAVLLDPLFEDHVGTAALRHRPDSAQAEVYVQIPPGGSVILRTFTGTQPSGPAWQYTTPVDKAVEVEGTWAVRFVEGAPVLPRAFTTEKLGSWTERDDPEVKRFAGTARYTIEFDSPRNRHASDYLLDLGKVADSARVTLNGQALGTLWCPPYSVSVGRYLKEDGPNRLEVEVTNVAANRIADLDRRGVEWKAFHEINFVNKDYRPFDASHWPLRASGLLGPVRLVPLKEFNPNPEQ